MSSRISFIIAVLLLLAAAVFRLSEFTTLPPGLHQNEITDLRIAETVRRGRIEVFYNLSGEGREGFYHTILAAHIGSVGSGLISYRILSVWIGLLTVALVYAIARRLFGPLAAVFAMALTAFNMLAIVFSRTIGREVLVPPLVAAVILALIIALPVYRRHYHRIGNTTAFAALGLLLGLGVYVHPVGVAVALMSMLFIAYVVLSQRPMSRRRLSYTSFSILLMIIIAMPYVISSIRLPELGGAARLLGNYQSLLRSVGDGLAGFVFLGDQNPALNVPGRPLIDLVSGMLVIVGIVTAARHWRQPRFILPLIGAIILAPTVLLATSSPNFAAYASTLPLIALFFGLGVRTILNSLNKNVRWIGILGLLSLLVFNVIWTAHDLFIIWPQLPETQQVYHSRFGQLAHYLDQTSTQIPSVVCAKNLNQPIPLRDLTGAQITVLMMNRQNAPIRYVDCQKGLIFIAGGDMEQVIVPESDMFETMDPYLRKWLEQGRPLDDPAVPPDGVIMLEVDTALADTIGRFTTTAPTGYAPEVSNSDHPVAPPVHFGGNLTFLGYEKETPAVYPPGGIVTVITYWRIDGVVPPDLTLFTHILGDPGATPVAQHDTISIDPAYLQNRDVFIQVTYVPLPTVTPNGDYFVSVGAYQYTSQERLDVLDEDQPRGTRLFLYPITVTKETSG